MTRRTKILGVILLVVLVALSGLVLVLGHDSPCAPAPALAANAQAMKAAVYRCYGPPEVVKIEAIEKPTLEDDRVLVKVRAASINPLDWHYVRGQPFIMRADIGVGVPKDVRLGVDFAGTIESVGKNVKRFKPGDEVFGARGGALAEYITVHQDRVIALKPAGLTFQQAAAVPVAALTALQGLRDHGRLQPGQKVLINGASGGVGTFAVQIAKSFGADVTGVSSTRNVELVRSLGADHVIDYTREDFTQGAQRYDLIFDCVGNHPLLDDKRVLLPHGIYIGIAGGGPEDQGLFGPLGGMLKIVVLAPFVSQKLETFEADLNAKDLALLRDLLVSGKVTPVVDRSFKLAQTAEAIRYLEQGHARGKVIVTMD